MNEEQLRMLAELEAAAEGANEMHVRFGGPANGAAGPPRGLHGRPQRPEGRGGRGGVRIVFERRRRREGADDNAAADEFEQGREQRMRHEEALMRRGMEHNGPPMPLFIGPLQQEPELGPWRMRREVIGGADDHGDPFRRRRLDDPFGDPFGDDHADRAMGDNGIVVDFENMERVMAEMNAAAQPIHPELDAMAWAQPAANPTRNPGQERQKAITFVKTGELYLTLAGECWNNGGDQIGIRHDFERLVGFLETNQRLELVRVGQNFFASFPDEADQDRILRAIANLPMLIVLSFKSSASERTHIHSALLLERIATTRNQLEELTIWNITVNNTSQLELLMNALQARGASLQRISLKLHVPDTPGVNRFGFLDPLLHTLVRDGNRQPPFFRLSGYDEASLNGPPLITVEGLRVYLAGGVEFNGKASRSVALEGLGLTDDHCQTIGEHFSTYESESGRMLHALWLRRNPAIGHEGYAVLLGLLNQHYATLQSIRVDDKILQDKFDFVVRMNTEFGRGQFLTDGTFSNRTSWLAWLEWLRKNAAPTNETEKARNVNFIFYSLQENPGFLSS